MSILSKKKTYGKHIHDYYKFVGSAIGAEEGRNMFFKFEILKVDLFVHNEQVEGEFLYTFP